MNHIFLIDVILLCLMFENFTKSANYLPKFLSILQQWRHQADGRKHYISGASGAVFQ